MYRANETLQLEIPEEQSFEMTCQFLWLIPLGFAIGAYGTLIGAGGGFILMPVLILLYPGEDRDLLTAISLAVVFFNASSGSWAYSKAKRIDYKSGLLFSMATVPGAVLGALTTAYVPVTLFDAILGSLMILTAAFLLLHPNPGHQSRKGGTRSNHLFTRSMIDVDGTAHAFSYNPGIGLGLSFAVGFVSSLLGIGGGIIHVPALVYLLNFPVHIATATSHFLLAIMALAGTVVHVASGTFIHGLHRTIFLAVGVLLGAQLGAWLSERVRGKWIMRGLAIALGFAGIRILLMAF